MPEDFKYAIDLLATLLRHPLGRKLLAQKLGPRFSPHSFSFLNYEFSPEDRARLKNIGGVLIGVGLILTGASVKIQSNNEIAKEELRSFNVFNK